MQIIDVHLQNKKTIDERESDEERFRQFGDTKTHSPASPAQGVDRGLYLSLWDDHDWRYIDILAYSEYYLAQLQKYPTRNTGSIG